MRAESSNPLAPTTFLKISSFRINSLQARTAKKPSPCVVAGVVTQNLLLGYAVGHLPLRSRFLPYRYLVMYDIPTTLTRFLAPDRLTSVT
jgi:hypothetical protein